MNTQKIGIIGGGKMATALIGGFITQGFAVQSIWVWDRNPEKNALLAQRWGVNIATDMHALIGDTDILILAIKPQDLRALMIQITDFLEPQKNSIISLAAGITCAQLQRWLAKPYPIIRAMPNQPAMIGAAMTGLFATAEVQDAQRQQAEHLMAAIGKTLWVETEVQMDVITALSGSGPAYFYYIMEGFIDGAVHLGLPYDTARVLTLQTAFGSALMAQSMDAHLSVSKLKNQVISPKGTTEQGINVLKNAKLPDILARALEAAYQRCQALSAQYD
jgi:pyrroline-5-carboxylate reductase